MDYVDAASQLGEAIVNSAAFITLKNAELALMQDDKAQTLMSDFRQLQAEMVRASREDENKENLEAIRDRLLAKQTELNEYSVTKDFFDGKKGFESMMKTINDIIAHYVNGGSSCGGNCSSCSGCH